MAIPEDKAPACSVRHHEDGSLSNFDRGVITPLSSLGGEISEARMHIAAGDIVGSSDTPDGERKAVLWRDATLTVLPNPFAHSEAEAIDAAGIIIGSGWDTRDDCPQGLIWDGGGPPRIIRGTPTAVDEAGLIVGDEPDGDCWDPAFRMRAFFWFRGELAYLPVPKPYLWSLALGIGNAGDIVRAVHVEDARLAAVFPLQGQAPCV